MEYTQKFIPLPEILMKGARVVFASLAAIHVFFSLWLIRTPFPEFSPWSLLSPVAFFSLGLAWTAVWFVCSPALARYWAIAVSTNAIFLACLAILISGQQIYGKASSIPLQLELTLLAASAPVILLQKYWRQALRPVGIFVGQAFLTEASPAAENRLKKNTVLLTMVGITILGLFLRLSNLDSLPPYTDEYFHLIAAKEIHEGVNVGDVYQRSLFVVTLPVALATEILGESLTAARVPGAVINLLAMIPLFWLVSRWNRSAALVVCFFYATNPWVIGVARTVREYGFYPLIYLGIAAYLFWVFEQVPWKWTVKSIATIRRKAWTFTLLVIAFLPLVYAFAYDSLSTLKTTSLTYAIFALFVLAKVDWKEKWTKRFLAGGLLGGVIVATLILPHLDFIALYPEYSNFWYSLLFDNPQQQWYFNRPMGVVWALLATSIAVTVISKKSLLWYLFGLFAIYFYFFSFHFSRYERPRYGFPLEVWFVISFGVAVYMAFVLARQYFGKDLLSSVLIGGVLAVFLINPLQVLKPVFFEKPDQYTAVTVEYHDNLQQTLEFIERNREPNDVLVATVFEWYSTLYGSMPFSEVIWFNGSIDTSTQDALRFIRKHESGWIVIDSRRIKGSRFPRRDFEFAGTRVNFIGTLDAQFVYRWGSEQPLSF